MVVERLRGIGVTGRIGLLFLIALAALRPAHAVPASSPAHADAAKQGAQPAFGDVAGQLALARQMFQEERYREAAEAMMSAYAIEGKPLYLFNAAQAYRKAQLYKEAGAQYRAYVEIVGSGALVNEAQGHIQDMEALIREQNSRQEVRMLLESEQAEKKKTQEQLESEQKKARQAEDALKKERNKPFYKKTWFHGLVGAGLSIFVTGLGIGLVVKAAADTDAGTRQLSFTTQ